MRARFATVMGILFFAATSAFAGPTSFNFGFGGPDTTLGTSQSFTSNGATITAFGYECSAPSPSSTSTLSNCAASALFAKNDGGAEMGLGLAGETDHEIGYDGSTADFVMGLDISDLVKLGATSLTLNFGSVQPGEDFAVLGYSSNPFLAGTPFALTNTKAFFGNDGSFGDVDGMSFDLNSQDEFLVLVSSCGASTSTALVCGSNVTLDSAATTPEPGTIALFVTGLAMLGFAMRKRWATQRN